MKSDLTGRDLEPPKGGGASWPAYAVVVALCGVGVWGALTGAGGSCRKSESPPPIEEPVASSPPRETLPRVVPGKNGDPLDGRFTLADATKDLPGTGMLVAKIDTSSGVLACRLYDDKAPITVANFIGLATGKRTWKDPATSEWVNRPAYDGTTFHRVIKGFMIQGGDPKGNGSGEPGYTFKDEQWGGKHDRAGLLCMANRGPNTNGAQFFIMDAPASHLDSSYTIFGECSPEGVVHDIANVPVGGQDKPLTPVTIASVRIVRAR